MTGRAPQTWRAHVAGVKDSGWPADDGVVMFGQTVAVAGTCAGICARGITLVSRDETGGQPPTLAGPAAPSSRLTKPKSFERSL